MTVVYSNKITITVNGITYTYLLELSTNTTQVPSYGGEITFIAKLLNQTTNQPVPNTSITLTDITTGSTAVAITDSTGEAQFTVSIPPNNGTSPVSYTFQASANV